MTRMAGSLTIDWLQCHYRNLATCTPSLANLVSQLLKRNLRQEGDPHDCEQDAAAAMQLVKHAILHGVPSAMEAPQVKASVHILNRWYCHLTGSGCSCSLTSITHLSPAFSKGS